MSAKDWNDMKTALEKACRKLGPGCSYEMKRFISLEMPKKSDIVE
jgi:hypothetical protein